MARQKLVHLHTSENRTPSADVLNFGEIAVMHNETYPSLFIKTGNSADTENAVARFIDKVQTETLIDNKISASTQEMIALKTEVVTEQGRIDALQNVVVTAVTVNGVSAELTPAGTGNKTATVTVDSDNVNVGTAITYGEDTLAATTDSTTDALQALSDKIRGIDTTVSQSNHGHENKAVLDGISAQKVSAWDDAAASAHTHANQAELDLIASGDKAKWDDAAASAHTHANKALLDTYTQTEANLADAVSKKHAHANEAVLDGITAEKVTAWDGAATNSHTHANEAVLDGITAEKVATWDTSAHTHENKALLDTYTQTEANLADAVSKKHAHANQALLDTYTQTEADLADAVAKKHEHANAAELALIQTGDVAKWNNLSTGATVAVSARTTSLEQGVLKAYDVYQGSSLVGTIDIPKDFLVKSGIVRAATTADTGFTEGEKILDFTINTIGDDETASHILISVADLVDAYTPGNGVEISTGNVVSAKVVAANGLSVDANGIAMALASASDNGAMSSADFTKLAGIESGAQVNILEGVQVNGADLTATNKKVNVTVTGGSANGTIAVNGSDVAVTGLGSAAFENTSAFDAAGAAEAASAAAITTVVGSASQSGSTLGALETRMDNMDLGEHNVIEGVQVNGSDLTPDASKKVNVTVAEGATDGTIAVNGTDIAVHGLGSAAFANTTAFDAAGDANAAAQSALTRANAYTDAQVLSSVTAATGDTLVEASVANKTVQVAASTALTAAVSAANSALQSVSNGTDGDYVTTTIGTKANGDQSIGVAVDVVEITAATASNKGLAEASDVKDYVDTAVAGKNVAATGDTLVSATAANNTVTVAATQALSNAVSAANASVQGIATGKESGAALDSDRKLDFSQFGIDCGEY